MTTDERAGYLTPQLSARQRRLSLAAVISAWLCVGLSFGIGFPLTALTFEAWHQPKWMIGLVGAVPAIAIIIVLPVLPRLVARLGTVTAIAGGCFAATIGFLSLYAFPLPWAWIAIRFLMSAGLALPWLAGETWINTVAQEQTRGRVIAVFMIAFFLGFSAGPFFLQTLGLTGPAPFLAGAAGTAIAGLPIIFARRLAPEFCYDEPRTFASAVRLAPFAMTAAFVGGFTEITYLSLLPNVAIAGGLSRQAALGLLSLITVGGVALQFPIGWLSDKVSRSAVMIGLAAVFIVLSLSLPIAIASPVASGAVALLLGGTVLGFYTLGLAIVGERVTNSDLAAANAAFMVMYQAGGIAGPLAAGVAMTMAPISGFVAAVVTLMAICTIVLVMLERRERHLGHATQGKPRG